MRARGARAGISVVVMGAVLALAPTAPVWAGVHNAQKHHKTHKHHVSTTSPKGLNADGSFCQLEKSTRQDENSKQETAATNALIAGNWSVAQKDLLAIDKRAGRLEVQFLAALASAPANVKTAAGEILKFVPSEEKAIEDSTSAANFESAEQSALGPKFSSAAATLSAYETAQCGSVTSST